MIVMKESEVILGGSVFEVKRNKNPHRDEEEQIFSRNQKNERQMLSAVRKPAEANGERQQRVHFHELWR